MAYDVGPVGLTVPPPQETPPPEPAPVPAESVPAPKAAPLPDYEGTTVDESA